MKLTGYSSSVFVRPGGSLGFHVHSESPNVDVQLVRLLHGDENPRGPGFQEREISSSIDGRHAAGPQEIFRGSFAELETPPRLHRERRLRDRPLDMADTSRASAAQGIISWRAPECPAGLCLALDETGRVVAQSGDAGGRTQPASRWRVVLGCVSGCGGVAAGSSSPSRLATIPRATRRRTFAMHCTARISLFGRQLTIAAAAVELDRKPASALPGFQWQDCEALASFSRRDAMRVRLCDRAARAPPDRHQARPCCDQPQSPELAP